MLSTVLRAVLRAALEELTVGGGGGGWRQSRNPPLKDMGASADSGRFHRAGDKDTAPIG